MTVQTYPRHLYQNIQLNEICLFFIIEINPVIFVLFIFTPMNCFHMFLNVTQRSSCCNAPTEFLYNMTNNTCGSASSQDCEPSHNRTDQLTGCNQPWQCAFRATGALHLSKRAIIANVNKQQVKISSLTNWVCWLTRRTEARHEHSCQYTASVFFHQSFSDAWSKPV